MHLSIPYILPIEGGLGAQLLSYVLYCHLKKNIGRVKLDLKYFQQTPKVASIGEGISIWPFLLNKYSIHIAENDISPTYMSEIIRKLSKKKISKKYLFDGGLQRLQLSYDAFSAFRQLRELEIPQEHKKKISMLSYDEPYSVIHIRRGDYVNVATRLIDLSSIKDAITSNPKFLCKRTFILSDGDIDPNEINCNLIDFLKINDPDPIFLNNLMRMSESLIVSNSQFSYSAALLSEKKKVLIPKNFFSDKKMNSLIFKRSEWINY